ncbi:MAG: CCA tRNA nucleotidyltransferase [Clostridia bacterium]|nr:CCA tRNA nucleotidyltransferase [Clostridia bacterium]
MKRLLSDNLTVLARACPKPLYLVGGFVRDYLCGLRAKKFDYDICGPMLAEEFAAIAQANGFIQKAVYKHTGTVKLSDGAGNDYEYTCFRSDKYIRGEHTPAEIYFTEDIVLDARRRDFTANAVYYDVAGERFVDPLGGIAAIKEKRLTAVDKADKVFGEDGLRLMRLARFCAQLGFTPDEEAFSGAKAHAELIDDISPERIFSELGQILAADEKYGVADGHYLGLQVLERIGVFERIFPELAKGKGLAQRADFHRYDVLEHSFRAVKYAPPSVRLAALLHDVGKPLCMLRDGNAHAHPVEGETLAKEILTRLKAPKKLTERICALVRWHMYDFDCKTGENKLKRFFVDHSELIDELLLLKQADFSGCTDDLSTAPTVEKWQTLLKKMRSEGAPMSLKALAVTGKDLLGRVPAPRISDALHALLYHAVCNPQDNTKERLLKILPKEFLI